MRNIFAIFILCATGIASADCGRRTFVTFPTTLQYPTREIVVQDTNYVAVPVLIPSFSFQYVSPCTMPSIPQTVPAPAPSAPTPSVGLASDDSIKQLAKALLAEMASQANPQDDGPPVVRLPGAANPGVDGMTVLSQRCASCHTGASSKAGIQIFVSPGYFNASVDKQRVVKAMEDGRMPLDPRTKHPVRLPAQEIAAVKGLLFGR